MAHHHAPGYTRSTNRARDYINTFAGAARRCGRGSSKRYVRVNSIQTPFVSTAATDQRYTH